MLFNMCSLNDIRQNSDFLRTAFVRRFYWICLFLTMRRESDNPGFTVYKATLSALCRTRSPEDQVPVFMSLSDKVTQLCPRVPSTPPFTTSWATAKASQNTANNLLIIQRITDNVSTQNRSKTPISTSPGAFSL